MKLTPKTLVLSVVPAIAFLSLPALAQANLKQASIRDEPNKNYAGTQYKKEIRNLNWKPERGWNGLVPGKSKIQDAKNVLGKETSTDDLTYSFEGPVRVTVKEDSSDIRTIEIFPKDKFFRQTPANVKDALTMYGPLKKLSGCCGSAYIKCLQRKGLLIEVDSHANAAKVVRLEFNSAIP